MSLEPQITHSDLTGFVIHASMQAPDEDLIEMKSLKGLRVLQCLDPTLVTVSTGVYSPILDAAAMGCSVNP